MVDEREAQAGIEGLEDLDETPDDEIEDEPEELVSEGYDFVLGAPEKQRLIIADYFKGASPESFIEAKGTGIKEDQVTAAAAHINISGGGSGGNRAARRKNKREGRGGDDVLATPRPFHGFIAKCRVQITGFKLVAKMGSTGQIVTREFGDATQNDEIFVSWLQPGNERMKDLVEGFLDKLAGRDTPTQKDFEALGNVR